MSKPNFAQWSLSWWQKFDKMPVGSAYEVAKCAKNVELFVEMGKDYIDHSPEGYNYEFSNDYKYFKKI